MKTPKEKYANDNNYRRLVDTLEALIVQAEFTPSEIREACMLACILNEQYRRVRPVVISAEAAAAMEILETEFLARRNF